QRRLRPDRGRARDAGRLRRPAPARRRRPQKLWRGSPPADPRRRRRRPQRKALATAASGSIIRPAPSCPTANKGTTAVTTSFTRRLRRQRVVYRDDFLAQPVLRGLEGLRDEIAKKLPERPKRRDPNEIKLKKPVWRHDRAPWGSILDDGR